MASNPTDLIRAADENHYVAECTNSDCAGCECASCGEEWPCEVRRLRDALRAERKDSALFENLYDEAQAELAERFANKDRDRAALVELIAARAEYDEARAALAEANATIQRVEATCDDLDRMNQDTPGMPHANYNREIRRNVVARIRRAIEGPS